jgi:hypothetical protein
VVCAALLPVGQALTASTTHRPAGEGSAAISGYTISGVHYLPADANPANLADVTFSIQPFDAGTVKIQLTPNGHTYDCTNAAGAVTCPISALPIEAAAELNVIAY